MLKSGKKIRALRDKKNKYSNSCVVRKKILNETKNHNLPPLQVKWSVPKEEEIERAIKNLKPGTSPDIDGISAEHYKNAMDELKPLILHMYTKYNNRGARYPTDAKKRYNDTSTNEK
jgi:hypothetical protein